MGRVTFVFLLLGSLLGADIARAQEIDRLLATVNGKVITDGDLTMSRALNAVIQLGKNEPAKSRPQELSRLVDLELIRQEMESFPIGQSDQSAIQSEVEKQLNALKNAYVEIGGLPALLLQLGLQEGELRAYLRLRVLLARFMEVRFRPYVGDAAGENVDEKVNAAMDQWIENMRNRSHIEFIGDSPSLPEKKLP